MDHEHEHTHEHTHHEDEEICTDPTHHHHHHHHQEPFRRAEPKVGRNEPCHCGSGKKFKKCHGA